MAIVCDSRAVKKGDTFVALAAHEEQRYVHLLEAQKRGAIRLLAEQGAFNKDGLSIEYVSNARKTFARLHAQEWGMDTNTIPVLGVTGTDGKTSTVHLAWHCLGIQAARVGTLGWHNGTIERDNEYTTPLPETLHPFIAGLPTSCPGVCVEISSHGCQQQRLGGISLSGLVWTGLAADHLDYHGSIEAYFQAKLQAVDLLQPGSLCIINAHDQRLLKIRSRALARGARVLTLGFDSGDMRIERVAGTHWRLVSTYAEYDLHVPMLGAYNAWNAAAAACLAHAAGLSLGTALQRLENTPQVPGRLEQVADEPLVFVDYAHTPQALERVLQVLREAYPKQKLICVTGCGGDRDILKRPQMGRVAVDMADEAIFTTDNPRSESPQTIVDAMCAQLSPTDDHCVELDRGRAIDRACESAGKDGVVLIAGKGHETYQEINGSRIPWDDRVYVQERIERGLHVTIG